MNENNSFNFNEFNVEETGSGMEREPIVYDSYYKQQPRKTPWATIIALILVIAIILVTLWIVGVFTSTDKQASYNDLYKRVCDAAVSYADTNFSSAKETSGKIMYVKVGSLSDADLIEADLINYITETPISSSTDIQLEVLPDGSFQCHGFFDPGEDTKKPIVTLNGEATINIGLGTNATDPGATAIDDVDGDISENIKRSGTVDPRKSGTYKIDYVVSDRAGNLSNVVQRTYIVQ